MDSNIIYLYDNDFSLWYTQEYFIDNGFVITNIHNMHYLKVDFDKKTIDSSVYHSVLRNIISEKYDIDIDIVGTSEAIKKISRSYRSAQTSPDVEQIIFCLPNDYGKIIKLFGDKTKKKEKFQFIDFNIVL